VGALDRPVVLAEPRRDDLSLAHQLEDPLGGVVAGDVQLLEQGRPDVDERARAATGQDVASLLSMAATPLDRITSWPGTAPMVRGAGGVAR
jgi:hypothetical protein